MFEKKYPDGFCVKEETILKTKNCRAVQYASAHNKLVVNG